MKCINDYFYEIFNYILIILSRNYLKEHNIPTIKVTHVSKHNL